MVVDKIMYLSMKRWSPALVVTQWVWRRRSTLHKEESVQSGDDVGDFVLFVSESEVEELCLVRLRNLD